MFKTNQNRNGQMILVFFISFIIVGLINLPYVSMPPIWDAAPGIFSPAIYLYESNFDLPSLLHSSGYLEAGPNVHSLSIVTFLTYGIIKLTNGQTEVYLPILHLLQFIFTAVVLTVTFNVAQQIFGRYIAIFVTLTLFLMPIFLVQTSYLYTEVIGAMLFLLGIKAWSNRRFYNMFLFAILSCGVKSFGLVLVFTLVILLLLDNSLLKRQRFFCIVFMVGTVVAIEAIKLHAEAAAPMINKGYFGIRPIFENLIQVPDLMVLILLSAAFPFVQLISYWRSGFKTHEIVNELLRLSVFSAKTRIWLGISILPTAFLLFLATVPLTGHIFFPLPRYYVWILPFMVLILTRTLIELHPMLLNSHLKSLIPPKKFAILMLAVVAILLGLNRNGELYPTGQALGSFSIAERSFEYINFFRVQRNGVQAIAKFSHGKPLIVTRGEYYFLSNPLMGYTDKHLDNINFILNQPYNSGDLNKYPSDFLLLNTNSNSFHGSHLIASILRQALRNPDYKVEELAHYQSGEYQSVLVRISVKSKIIPMD